MLKKRKFKSIFVRRSREEMPNVYSGGNRNWRLLPGKSSLRLCPIAGDKSNEYIQDGATMAG